MSSKKEIKRLIKEKIKQNIPKSQIVIELSSKYDAKQVERIIRNYPEPELKTKYNKFHKMLIACIVISILFKMLSVVGLGMQYGLEIGLLMFVLALILPVLLIIYLSTYKATAYLLTAALFFSSLTNSLKDVSEIYNSGDWISLSLSVFLFAVIIAAISLSIFLWRKIYPDYLKKSS